ncbi:ANK [Mytilus coruscus]|uniref:ANK n=1 Tax=Mytilus coruscus TaxID=42192 RepID=A0A6J8CD00_MYTCO|nr:ANK [Mytilus coruscus]
MSRECTLLTGFSSTTRQVDGIFIHSLPGEQMGMRPGIDGFNKNKITRIIPSNLLGLQEKEIMKLRKRHHHFEITYASKAVLKTVKTHGFLIISGPPGSGKSAKAYNTAFMLEQKEGFTILSVSSPEDIRTNFLPETKQLFLIDDPIGKYTVDNLICIQRWTNEETFIKQTFTDRSNSKLILTCRSYIYKSGFSHKLSFSPVHCDLLSHNLKMTVVERANLYHRSKLLTFLERLKAGDLTCDQNDSTPLHVVSIKGYDDLVYKRFQLKTNQINLQDKNKRTPLFMACIGCPDKVIQTLLAIDSSSLHVANIEDLTPFDVASINDDVSTLIILLKYDAKVNRKDKQMKRTALQRACDSGSYNAVTFLLTKNADVKLKGTNGLKAIHIACSKRHLEIVELLLKHDKNMINECDDDSRTPLFTSCESNQQNIVFMLLKNKGNVNKTNVKGASPLYKGCKIGNENIVGKLLDYSAKVNVQSENGFSPLYIACLNGNTKIVKLLLHKSAEVNLSTEQGWTPFLISCSKGYLEICKLLLERGANINTGNKSSYTPLPIAFREKHKLIVRFLTELGANVNEVNRKRSRHCTLPV